ncbi:Lrp/AsnC family transcriptional regulator [Ahrensia kielensis]|uniref:Lrp/AsnC family transcriptional regulator n=1 Tax=Ahrensia kielensis TaxID=76980 RepID=UPI00036AB09C|nr:Lrp/AsnC family transcriptional regulator [Ahrensia kielensis]
MPSQYKVVDSVDLKILYELDKAGRISYSELASKVGMSSPSVAERVKRMESAGIIRNFTVDIDYGALGQALEAIVRIKPRPGNLHIIKSMIIEEPRFTACDAVTGDDCFVCRLVFGEMKDLDAILEPFHEKAETNTAIIKSSPVRRRLPQIKASQLR